MKHERRIPAWLLREACRRLGYNPGLVKLKLADLPPDTDAMIARIRSCMDQMQNLSRAAAHYTEILRRRWSAASIHAAHGSTLNPLIALNLSSDRRERPSKDEGGFACARGPPPFFQNRRSTSHTSAPPLD